jgi:hypothetical protein
MGRFAARVSLPSSSAALRQRQAKPANLVFQAAPLCVSVLAEGQTFDRVWPVAILPAIGRLFVVAERQAGPAVIAGPNSVPIHGGLDEQDSNSSEVSPLREWTGALRTLKRSPPLRNVLGGCAALVAIRREAGADGEFTAWDRLPPGEWQRERPLWAVRRAVRLASVTWSLVARYLRLGLELGRHVEGVVDAYFGPPELAEAVEAERPIDPRVLVSAAESLLGELEDGWLRDQVVGLRNYAGALAADSYADEVEGCFGVRPTYTDEAVFAAAHERVAELLPGGEPLAQRYQRWLDSSRVPTEQIERTVAAVIAEARAAVLTARDEAEIDRVTGSLGKALGRRVVA